jgi:hypothetical protein
MRMQPFPEALLDSVGGTAQLHGRCPHRTGHDEFYPQQEHEDKTEQFHRRLHVAAREKRGKPGEGDETVDDLHHGRPQANHHRPGKPAPRSFVQNGQVNRSNRDGQQQTAQETSHSRNQDGMQIIHVGALGVIL